MISEASISLGLREEQDIVLARQIVRKAAVNLGFSIVEQTKIVTAASELARNAVIHGKGGEMICEPLDEGYRKGLRLTFCDKGPGITDIALAMTDGWTSGTGMGLGLSGSKRLVDEFEIKSIPNEGTEVKITRWRSR